MRVRWIAGFVLCALLVWANPPAWSGERLPSQPPAAAEARSVHETHASAADHPCCPGLKSNVVLQAAPLANPCGGQHRCCFSHGPAVPPSLPVSSERAFAGKAISPADITAVFVVSARNFACADALRAYSALSMVLRL